MTQAIGQTGHPLGCSGSGNTHQRVGKWCCLWRCRNDCLSILLPSLVCSALWGMEIAHLKRLASLSVVHKPVASMNLGTYYKYGVLSRTPAPLNESILVRGPADSWAHSIGEAPDCTMLCSFYNCIQCQKSLLSPMKSMY